MRHPVAPVKIGFPSRIGRGARTRLAGRWLAPTRPTRSERMKRYADYGRYSAGRPIVVEICG
jgi:hypothetical protein